MKINYILVNKVEKIIHYKEENKKLKTKDIVSKFIFNQIFRKLGNPDLVEYQRLKGT